MPKKSNNLARAYQGYSSNGSSPELPTSLMEVKSLLANTENLVGMSSWGGQDYFDVMINRLKSIQQKVYQSECDLFRDQGPFAKLGAEDSYKGVRILQEKIDQLNKSNPGFLAMNNNGAIFESSGGIKHIERLRDAVQEGYQNTSMNIVVNQQIKDTLDASDQDIKRALATIIDNSVVLTKRTGGYNKEAAKALFESCDLIYNPDSYTITIKNNDSKGSQDLFKKWKPKLEADYGIYLKKADFKFAAITEAVKAIVGAGSEIWPYVEYQLEHNHDKFDVNPSNGAIIGFLGEVKANALFDYLLNEHGAAVPTGNVRNIASGQEIPVDLIIKSFGFQVKNFVFSKNGTFAFTRRSDKSMLMPNFIQSRLNLSLTDYVGLALLTFFGSYQFNQPSDTPEDEYSIGAYRQIYSGFRQLIGANAEADSIIHNIFSSHLDSLLRIIFPIEQTTADFYNSLQISFNTMFIINTKLIPSSAILQALITNLEQIRDHEQHTAVRTQYFISQPVGDGIRWKPPITQEDANDNASVSAIEAANYIKVHYRIEFDLNNILSIINSDFQ